MSKSSNPRRGAALGALAILVAGACGSEPAPPPKQVTAQDMKDFWALNAGSCWLYRAGGNQVRVTVDGPDDRPIAGRKVYIYRIQALSGGTPVEYYFDADTTPGKLLLARLSEPGAGNAANVETYQEPLPVLSTLAYDRKEVLQFNASDVIETISTPRPTTDVPMPAAIKHTISVRDRARTVGTSSATASAINLSYARDGGKITVWNLVPRFGIALFTQANVENQVCAARVCDAAGQCRGAADCAASLFCPN